MTTVDQAKNRLRTSLVLVCLQTAIVSLTSSIAIKAVLYLGHICAIIIPAVYFVINQLIFKLITFNGKSTLDKGAYFRTNVAFAVSIGIVIITFSLNVLK